MERRFVRVWEELRERRDRGESFPRVLRETSSADLVSALAAAGVDDAVAANVIATELLNRLRRAAFLGASLVGFATAFLIVALDWAFTGTLLAFEAGARARILLGITLAIALGSMGSFALWKWPWTRVRRVLTPLRAPRL